MKIPTPIPTPDPESSLSDPAGSTPIGPYGTPIYPDNPMDACLNLPGDGQPPDVAGNVSPTQIVEMLNSGIWISDESGNPYAGYPEGLTTFWQANSPPSTDFLSDTQIVWDPIAQRWLATTLAVTNTRGNGDLYFAFSKTSDATQGWNVYKLANICSGSQNGDYPLPDQPVIGYNDTWAAVDLQCKGLQGVGTGSDRLVMVDSTVLTQTPAPSTLPTTIGTPPSSGSRPSRDVSGTTDEPLYLAASQLDSSTSQMFVQLYVVNVASGTEYFIPAGQSPDQGAPATYGNFSPAQHDSCGAGAACAVSLQDARISSVIFQEGNDGNPYLLTSFHAGDASSGTTQALWFVYQPVSDKWNEWWVGGSGWWAGYPTITMDSDLGIAFTFQTFYYGSSIYPNWYIAKGFDPTEATNPPLLGYGILGNPYRGAYAGCAGQQHARWGDYMSTIWDPNLPAPASSNGFWTAQEYSNGGGSQTGSNQSTQISELANPLPYFVSENQGESECGGGGDGTTCHLSITTPSGLKDGDVVLAFLEMGGKYDKPPAPPDSTWTELPIGNQGGATHTTVGTCPYPISIYAYAHVYGSSSETGTYKVKHVISYICNKTNEFPEIEGAVFAYRGADPTAADYVVNAYASAGPTGTITVGPAPNPSPSDGTLINVFQAQSYETSGGPDDDCGSLSALTGTPLATWETDFYTTFWLQACYADADAGIPAAGTKMNQYSATTTITSYPTFGWQVLLPPK